MGFILTTTAGLIVWIVLWALGAKGFDAFLITMLVVLVACGSQIVKPFLPNAKNT